MDDEHKYMSGADADVPQYDVVLRQDMLGVYNHMMAALAFTGIVAYGTTLLTGPITALTPFGQALYLSPLKWVVLRAPIGMVLLLSARVRTMSPGGARVLIYVVGAVMGLSLFLLPLFFPGAAVARGDGRERV